MAQQAAAAIQNDASHLQMRKETTIEDKEDQEPIISVELKREYQE